MRRWLRSLRAAQIPRGCLEKMGEGKVRERTGCIEGATRRSSCLHCLFSVCSRGSDNKFAVVSLLPLIPDAAPSIDASPNGLDAVSARSLSEAAKSGSPARPAAPTPSVHLCKTSTENGVSPDVQLSTVAPLLTPHQADLSLMTQQWSMK